MKTNELKKKGKRTINPIDTAVPQASSSRSTGDSNIVDAAKPLYPLLAKDSEWVDIVQNPARSLPSESVEAELESEDGPEKKPLAIMFPALLEKDSQTFRDMLTKTMSTTEVTKHLVGQKANFKFMKKASRLIPPDKLRLGSVTEISSPPDLTATPTVSGITDYKSCEDDENIEDHTSTSTHKHKKLNPLI